MATDDIQAAIAELEKAQSLALVTHRGPDGDAIGSSLALALALRDRGKDVRLYARAKDVGAPRVLEGLEILLPPEEAGNAPRPDLLVCLDCASQERISVPFFRDRLGSFRSLSIDHHESNPRFCDVNFVVDDASSTGELVWNLLLAAGWPVSRKMAEALWVAIITDSGRFAYDSTKPGTLRAAGDLLKHGVRTAMINDIIYNTFPRKAIELKRLAWRSLHVWKNRKVAEVTLTRDDFRAVRGKKADAEDVIEIPRQVAKNEIALFFYQIPDRTKETRCSIRTRGDWDATTLAAKFGGGGHLKAAGCTIKASMSAAKRQMRAAVKEMLKSACRKTMRIKAEDLK